ncbi:hypothetical protein J6590_025534 [Homalodisca vitripennis]|nr:hypothetical protein J6590_025534 [Homalodisca vitripennis]
MTQLQQNGLQTKFKPSAAQALSDTTVSDILVANPLLQQLLFDLSQQIVQLVTQSLRIMYLLNISKWTKTRVAGVSSRVEDQEKFHTRSKDCDKDKGLVLKDEIKEEPVDVEPSEVQKESVTVYIKKENNVSLYEKTENDEVIMAKQDELENEGGNSNSHGEGYNGILRDILTNCKTLGLETEESSVDPSVTFEDNIHENYDIMPCVPQKTHTSVSKENQAMELQSLEGFSGYDQGTLEAERLNQVDQALDKTVESTEMLESTGESSMERQIRLGEMTPFGSTLDTAATTARNQKIELREIEEYFEKQMELQGMLKQRMNKRKPQAEYKLKDSENLSLAKTLVISQQCQQLL